MNYCHLADCNFIIICIVYMACRSGNHGIYNMKFECIERKSEYMEWKYEYME